MSMVDAGSMDWTLNADTGKAEEAFQKANTRVQAFRHSVKGAEKDLNDMGESLEKGLEHSLHHGLRHAGMGSIMLGAGGGAFLATAGIEAMQKIYEAFSHHIEEMKKAIEEAAKEAEKQTKGSGEGVGINQRDVYAIHEAHKNLSPDVIAKIGSAIRKDSPGASNEQIADAIEKYNNTPAPGGQELLGSMMALGADTGNYEKINQNSSQRGAQVAAFMLKNKKRIQGRHIDPNAAFELYSEQISTMDEAHANRAFMRATEDDFTGASKRLSATSVYSNTEIEGLRAKDKLDEHAKQREGELADYRHMAEKQIIMQKFQEAYPGYWGAERSKKFMDKKGTAPLGDFEDSLYHKTDDYLGDGRIYEFSFEANKANGHVNPGLAKLIQEVGVAITKNTKATDNKTQNYTQDTSHH